MEPVRFLLRSGESVPPRASLPPEKNNAGASASYSSGTRLATSESYRSRVECERSLFMVKQSSTASVEMGEGCHTYLLNPSVKGAPPWERWSLPQTGGRSPLTGRRGADL